MFKKNNKTAILKCGLYHFLVHMAAVRFLIYLFILSAGILSCPVCKQTCFARDVVENFFLKDFHTDNSAMAKVSESH